MCNTDGTYIKDINKIIPSTESIWSNGNHVFPGEIPTRLLKKLFIASPNNAPNPNKNPSIKKLFDE